MEEEDVEEVDEEEEDDDMTNGGKGKPENVAEVEKPKWKEGVKVQLLQSKKR